MGIRRRVALVALGTALLLSCRQATESGPGNGALYFSSFESDKDTVGWNGYGGLAFVADAPTGGGDRSVRVTGGCIVPHASFAFSAPSRPCTLWIQCWAKNLSLGGVIVLRRSHDPYDGIEIAVRETTWTLQRSSSQLVCGPNEHLTLEMSSGGFVASAMLVDLLEVKVAE